MMNDLERIMIANTGPILFRLVWWNYLDPSKRADFAEELFDAIAVGVAKSFEEDKGTKLPDSALNFIRPVLRSLVEKEIGDFSKHIPAFDDNTYETVVSKILKGRSESQFYRLFAGQYDVFTSRIANLSEELISAVRVINEEFMIWLKTHTDHTAKIHADAFEQITGEILTSHGFSVAFTGRVKNRSADLLAIQRDEHGVLVKYLIECKRYDGSKKVGIEILNAVVGASFRAKVSHALLVTTSSFTSGVFAARAELEDFRLDLHDGAQITEWLSDYELKDFGLWLPDGWRDVWTR